MSPHSLARIGLVTLAALVCQSCAIVYLTTDRLQVPFDDSLETLLSGEELEQFARETLDSHRGDQRSPTTCNVDLRKRRVNIVNLNFYEEMQVPLSEAAAHVRSFEGGAVVWITRRGDGVASAVYCSFPTVALPEDGRMKLGRLLSVLAAYDVYVAPGYQLPESADQLQLVRKGEIHLPDGSRFEGMAIAGKPSGQGVLHYPNGDRYEGPFEKGVPEGKGVLHLAGGGELRGVFKSGKPPKSGVIRAADGTTWKGPIRNGKLHGKGRMILADGTVYEGPFEQGQRHGRFRVQLAEGRDRTQQWEQDRLRFDAPGPKSLDRLQAVPTCRLKTKRWLFLEGGCENGWAKGPGRAVAADPGHPMLLEGHFDGGDLASGRMNDAAGNVFEGRFQGFRLQGSGSHMKGGELVFEGHFLAGEPLGEGLCGVEGAIEPCEIRDGERVDEFHLARLAAKREQERQERCGAAWKRYQDGERWLRSKGNEGFCEDQRQQAAEDLEEMAGYQTGHPFSQDGPGSIRGLFRCANEVDEQAEGRLKTMKSAIGALRGDQCADESSLAAAEQGRRALGEYIEGGVEANKRYAKGAREQFHQMARAQAARRRAEKQAFDRAMAQSWVDWQQNALRENREFIDETMRSLERIDRIVAESRRSSPAPAAQGPPPSFTPARSAAPSAPSDPFAALRRQCAARNGRWDEGAKSCQVPMHRTRVVIQHPGSACYDPSGQTCTTGETLGGNAPAHSGMVGSLGGAGSIPASAAPLPAEPVVTQSKVVQGDSDTFYERETARDLARLGVHNEARSFCPGTAHRIRLDWLDNGCDAMPSDTQMVKCWFRAKVECLDRRCDQTFCGTDGD